MKDNRGFLWIGTADGLNRYDGKNFVQYFHSLYNPNSIPNNSVNALKQIDDGMIWIGTFNGLCKLNPLNNEISRIGLPDNLRTTEIVSVGNIEQNPYDRSIWIASNKGLFYVDDKKNLLVPAPEKESFLSNQFITAIHFVSNEILWLSSYEGLIRYNRLTGKTEFFQPPASSLPKSTLITSIIEDEKGILWLGTWGRGLQSFDPSSGKFVRYLAHPEVGERSDINIIQSLSKSGLPGEENLLWVAGDALFAFNKESKQFVSFSSADKNNAFGLFGESLSFCNGKEEGMWIGSTNGLYRRDPHHQLFNHVELGIKSNGPCISGIFTIYADPIDSSGNTLLVSTWSCSSFRVNSKEKTSTKLPVWMLKAAGPLGHFNCFYRDKNGQLWATTSNNGLVRFEEKNNRFHSYSLPENHQPERIGHLREMIETENGNFWLSSYNGIYYYDRNQNEILPICHSGFGTPNNVSSEVKSMELDKEGNLWFCTNLGLNKKSAIGKIPAGSLKPTWFFYDESKKEGFPERSPLESISIDDKDNVWCATWNGIIYWNGNEINPVFKRLTREDGLSNDKVYRLKTDKQNRIWSATLMGLSCFDPASNRFRNFFSEQGLHEDEIGGLFKNEVTGELIATYWGGFDILNPSKLSMTSKPPSILITGLKIFNEPYSQNKKFFIDRGVAKLSPSQNMLTIYFSALSFTDPGQVKYAYKMEGIDKDWIVSQNDFVTYHNLIPGERRFLIKASNAEGTWNEDGTWMDVILAPPFYNTWWFIALLVLVFFGGVYVVYYNRISRLKEKYRIRSTIARDLHDEIGSTLTSINILSRVSHTNLEKDKSKASDLIQKITEQSESMQQSMSDIIWAIKPENDKLRNMAIRMREYLSHTLESRNIQIRFLAEENVLEESLSMEQRRDFFLIFKEAINNAAKYSESNVVQVEIKKTGKHILLTVKDQGKGFKLNGLHSSNGLKNMQARAATLHARLSVISAPGKGTTVQLVLPAT